MMLQKESEDPDWNWQVSVMDPVSHLEYTYDVTHLTRPGCEDAYMDLSQCTEPVVNENKRVMEVLDKEKREGAAARKLAEQVRCPE
jgi:hypothetical protein